jgi:hypothetical protein
MKLNDPDWIILRANKNIDASPENVIWVWCEDEERKMFSIMGGISKMYDSFSRTTCKWMFSSCGRLYGMFT